MNDAPTAPGQGDDAGSPVYMAGLDLRGRRVLVVGAGRVAARRLPALLAAGAQVEVVAPQITDAIRELASADALVLHERAVTPDDVEGAWYVLVATQDVAVNDAISAACERAHIFCVRADHAPSGTAWTPATQRVGEFTVGVLGNRDPRGSMRVRDMVAGLLREAQTREAQAGEAQAGEEQAGEAQTREVQTRPARSRRPR
ncbi:precorrin-2 dehydrogenase/sirohydrochlorin ferrochelatase family protein [Luteococcus sp. Sow4_B9]|uniref:precorrin-2 dehydrogenase/sirohydrochlorin ferrochelatase family protein n=1 Tax=Luteococcus sp. Sow4_B9 TaxID=3438792 RepID=UPI003F976327